MNAIEQSKRLRVATLDAAEATKVVTLKLAEAEMERKHLQGVGASRQRGALVEDGRGRQGRVSA